MMRNPFKRKPKPEMYTIDDVKRAINALSTSFSPRWDNMQTVSVGGSSFAPEYMFNFNMAYIRAKALELWWTSVHVRGAIEQKTNLTVNSGLRLQSSPVADVLGISPEKAREISRMIERDFGMWRLQNECSFDDMDNFNEIESLIKHSEEMFDEFFAIFRYSSRRDRINPLSIQIINPMLVVTPPNIQSSSIVGQCIDGIQYYKNKPTGFWVQHTDEDLKVKHEFIPFFNRQGMRVGVHSFEKKIAGQKRGIPNYASMSHEFERIMESLKNEMDTMSANSKIAGSIERDKPVMDTDKLKVLLSSAQQAPTQIMSSIDGKEENIDRKARVVMDGGGFWMQQLEEGERFNEFDTKRPNVNIQEFIRRHLDVAGPAVGLASEIWLMLFGHNYSASRGTVSINWKSFDKENFNMSSDFHKPALEAFAWGQVANGRWMLPGFEEKRTRAAYLNCQWFGQPEPSLNPYQELAAAKGRIDASLSNHERESQKLTGTSFDDNIERLNAENLKLAQNNISRDGFEMNLQAMEQGNTIANN